VLVSAPRGSPWQGAFPAGRNAVLQDQGAQVLVSMKSGARIPQRLRPNKRMEQRRCVLMEALCCAPPILR